jgi:hypothetical protein
LKINYLPSPSMPPAACPFLKIPENAVTGHWSVVTLTGTDFGPHLTHGYLGNPNETAIFE